MGGYGQHFPPPGFIFIKITNGDKMPELSLDGPKDIRELIRKWIAEACELKRLPFEKDGGTIVQLLNVWLRSYETDKLEDIEKRLSALEGKQ
jgi:hypothetical protein